MRHLRSCPRMRLFLSAWLLVAPYAQAAEFDYTIQASGLNTGRMQVDAPSGTTREIHYEFNDRGRGSNIESRVEIDARRMPIQLSVRGVDYYKRPVDETFARSKDSMTWRSASDVGHRPGADAFYLPVESTSEHLAMLVRAALERPDNTLPLVPQGTARVERMGTQALAVDGRGTVQATLYAIHGIGFSAYPVWLDESRELILEGSSWFAVVRAGYEAHTSALIAQQQAWLTERQQARAATLGNTSDKPLAIVGVSLYDAETRKIRDDMTVIVRATRIAAVGPSRDVIVPADARRIDGRGRTLVPGLWDMHVHLSSDEAGMLHLAAGVTTVRDMGNAMDDLLSRRDRFAAGGQPGPRVFMAGFIDGPGPLAGPIKVLAKNESELRAAIDNYAKHGYAQIKLYSSLDPALVPVATRYAHALGMRVSGHVPAGMTMQAAVAAGYDEVQHLNFPMLNFMGAEINAKTNDMTRFTAVAEHAHALDMASADVGEFIALLKAHETVIDPTISIFENHFIGRVGQPAPNLAAVIDRLPPVVQRGSYSAGLAANETEAGRNRQSFQRMLEMLRTMHEAGIRIVPGTDDMEGFTYHRELELYQQAGIPPLDILYMATLGSARVMKQDHDLGSIAPGKLADLVLVRGHPGTTIGDIRNVEQVVKNGVIYDAETLYREVGVAPLRSIR